MNPPATVRVWTADGLRDFKALGWAIGDPPGWVQIIQPESVWFYPARIVLLVEVPNLETEADQ